MVGSTFEWLFTVYREASSYKLVQHAIKIEIFFVTFNDALSSVSFETCYVTGDI